MQRVREIPTQIPTFQAPVGEGEPRVFYYDMWNKALYTYVDETDTEGGFDITSHIKITAASTDEFSARCWQMTGAHRKKYDDDVASSNGKPVVSSDRPTEGPGINPEEEVISESVPVNAPQEEPYRQFPDEIPAALTPANPPPPPAGTLTEDDMVAAVVITALQGLVKRQYKKIERYIEDDNIKELATDDLQHVQGILSKYGLETTQGSDNGDE